MMKQEPAQPEQSTLPAQDSAPLEALQHWVMHTITAPQGLVAGLARAQQLRGWQIDDIIAAPAGVDPARGLDVYARAYWLRLLACLQNDYPALRRHLGEQLFDFFCRAYLHQHPSRSFSLYALGSEFARFLRRTQSASVKAGNDLRFPLELALLENARNVSRRAEGLEQWTTSNHTGDALALLLGAETEVTLPGSTLLLLTAHPLSAFQAWLDGNVDDHPPLVETGHIAIARQNYHVSFHALTDWQFYALSASRRSPRSLAYCARAAARRCHRPVHALLTQLVFWLPAAQDAGLVRLKLRSPG